MNHNKIPERKTFIQERFEILIKKQKNGEASFNELTELDEIVNKNAAIREHILEELQGINYPSDDMMTEQNRHQIIKEQGPIWLSIKMFFDKLFSSVYLHQNPVLIQ